MGKEATSFEARRAAMVRGQLASGGIADERVLTAMGAVPREEFVPERWRKHAYDDGALPIGHEQTISQPWVVAAICEALELQGHERVLEVGTGSGYSAAVLAQLANEVITVELVPELGERARQTLARLGYDNVEVQVGDGGLGLPGPLEQQFDAIAVHAAAPGIPPRLGRLLRPAGRIVVPIKERGADMLTAFTRGLESADEEPSFQRRRIAPCRFVPLLGEAGFSTER